MIKRIIGGSLLTLFGLSLLLTMVGYDHSLSFGLNYVRGIIVSIYAMVAVGALYFGIVIMITSKR